MNVFLLFVIISPWKRTGPFIWTILNPFHHRMLCAKFGWNWLNDSGEEDFLKVISLFCNYLPLEKGEAIHLNKLESYWPNDVLCHGPVGMEEKIFKFCQYIFTFYHLLVRHLDKLKSPSPKDGLYQVWLKLVPWFWRKRRKCEKSTEKFQFV